MVASRSVINLSGESSERFAFGKNRDIGGQDGTGSVRLRSVFCQAGLASWVYRDSSVTANPSAKHRKLPSLRRASQLRSPGFIAWPSRMTIFIIAASL